MSTSGELLPHDPIGTGRTSEVFAWGEGRVLKLLLPNFPPALITSEAAKTAAAHAAGAPAPAVHERVYLAGRRGIVFDEAGAGSMLDQLIASPWRFAGFAARLASIHADVLACRSEELPDVKEFLAQKIDRADPLTATDRNRAKDALRQLPDGESVLHGDYHPGNVFSTTTRHTVIDWTEAARGAPAADVTRTLWLLSPVVIPPGFPRRRLARALARAMRAVYRQQCFRLLDLTDRDLDGWWLPTVAARLSEGIEEEQDALVAEVRERLS